MRHAGSGKTINSGSHENGRDRKSNIVSRFLRDVGRKGIFPRQADQEFKGGKYTLKAVIVAYDSIETHAVLLPVCGGGDGHYLTEHAREMIAV